MANYKSKFRKEELINLANWMPEYRLIEFIMKLDSSFNYDNCRKFISYMENKYPETNNLEKLEKIDNDYLKFKVLACICEWELFYQWWIEKILKEELQTFKDKMISKAHREATEYQAKQQKLIMVLNLVKFYLWLVDEEECKKLLGWENCARELDSFKTLEKIKKKKENKNKPEISKIYDLIYKDIDRGYYKWIRLSDEDINAIKQITNSHGFGIYY